MDSIFATPRTDTIESKLKRAIAGEPEPNATPSFAYAFWQAAGTWAETYLAVAAQRERRLRFDYKEFIRMEMPNARTMSARYAGTWCAFCQDPITIGQRILYQREPRYRIIHADVETCLRSKFLADNSLTLGKTILACEARAKTQAHDAK